GHAARWKSDPRQIAAPRTGSDCSSQLPPPVTTGFSPAAGYTHEDRPLESRALEVLPVRIKKIDMSFDQNALDSLRIERSAEPEPSSGKPYKWFLLVVLLIAVAAAAYALLR